MKTVSLIFFSIGLFPLLFFSCSEKGNEQTILQGNSRILTDEAFYPLLSAEQDVFAHFYKEATLQVEAVPQESALEKLVKGEVEMAVVSRELNQEEQKYLASQNVHPEAILMAYDALVFIASINTKDSVLPLLSLPTFFSGDHKLVVDQSGSAIVNFLADTIRAKDSLRLTAAGSMEKVVSYILSDQEAVGLISLSVFKNNFSGRKDIKVLGIRNEMGEITYPFQEDLALGRYPFKMPVFLINRYKSGLGTGFASYVLSENGQRIVLKSGLLPVTMPGREVIIKKEF